jgi:hypothetical protein
VLKVYVLEKKVEGIASSHFRAKNKNSTVSKFLHMCKLTLSKRETK